MSYQMAYSAPLYNQQQEQSHYPSPAPSPNHYQQPPPHQQYPISYQESPQQPPNHQYAYQPQAYPFQGYPNQGYSPQQQQQQQHYTSPPVPQQQHQNYHQTAAPPPAVPAHLIVPSQHSEPYPQEPVFPQASPSAATAAYAPPTPQSLPPVTPQPRAPITPQSNPSATPDLTPPPTTTNTSTMAQNMPFNLGPTEVFELTIQAKDAQTDLFIPTTSTTRTPLYTATYTKSNHCSHSRDEPHTRIYHHSPADPMRQIGSCTYHSFFSNKLGMNVLGLPWEFDTNWVSDVGTRPGHNFEWRIPKKQSKPVGFTLHCVDNGQNNQVICCVKIQNYNEGHIQIPGGVVKDQKGLDEMVCVAVSVMHRMRGKIRKEGAGAVGPEAAGKVDTDLAKTSFKAGWQFASLASGGGGA